MGGRRERSAIEPANGSGSPAAAFHPLIVDLAIALSIAIVLLVFEAVDGSEAGASLDAADLFWCLVASGLVLMRRFAPLPVLAVALIGGIWSLTPADDQVVLRVAACLALYTVAANYERRVAWGAGVAVGGALFVTALITNSGPWFAADNLQQIAWAATATAAGDAVRSRRAYLAERKERAKALQQRRAQLLEEVSRRRVIEERLRIARELHDVVAHHIAVINVQAGVAAHLLRDDPTGAETALAHVRRGAGTVLDELGSMLNVMRRPDDPDPATEPAPSLDQLETLIGDFAAAGLEVEWSSTGALPTLSPAAALAAYRIVQESLTNARRHGAGGRVLLTTDSRPTALSIEIVNDIAAGESANDRAGHGLIGMRERVAAVGGTIETGSTGDGRFRVRVTLPVNGEES